MSLFRTLVDAMLHPFEIEIEIEIDFIRSYFLDYVVQSHLGFLF
jgi:hypothetical protein